MTSAREAFEEWTRMHRANWPLGIVTLGGKFLYYMDPDTDTAWIGFLAGWTLAKEGGR